MELQKYIGIDTLEATPMIFDQARKVIARPLKIVDHRTLGYYVVRDDGFETWVEKNEFEKVYLPMNGMSFSLAFEALKSGKQMTRESWNGEFIFLMSRVNIPLSDVYKGQFKELLVQKLKRKGVFSAPCLCKWSLNSEIITGWVPSQADMFAGDWVESDFLNSLL